jgi:hypothetical protein
MNLSYQLPVPEIESLCLPEPESARVRPSKTSIFENCQGILREHVELQRLHVQTQTELQASENRLIVARNLCMMYGVEPPTAVGEDGQGSGDVSLSSVTLRAVE